VAAAVAAGADAVGFNFYPQSKRFLNDSRAVEVTSSITGDVAKVGVFVNTPVADVIHTADRCRLDVIQLHGDESPEYIQQLAGRPVLKAFRFGSDGWQPIERYLADCATIGVHLEGVLIDSFQSNSYGGTGHRADWKALADWRSRLDLPLLLAGGLTPANVAEAIRIVRPTGVDTASGVESEPGRKDTALVREFVTAASVAFTAID